MVEKDKIDKYVLTNALWNTFPSVESFNEFRERDYEISRRAIPRIIKYAFKNEIIEKQTEKAFVEFLAKNNQTDINKPLPEELTFADVLEVLAGNISVNTLVKNLGSITKELSMPSIQATMITRLKKHFILNTTKQRCLLRILALKLAEKHPDLNWHYEMLRKITIGHSEKQDLAKEKAGVTIALKLQGKGEIIVPTDIIWLKSELSSCIRYLNLATHVHSKTITSSGAASFSLKLPKKLGPIEQPRLYDRAIRDILAIAHQMSVRWLLSENSTPQKQLVIIIHAGRVSDAGLAMQPLLDAKLTGGTCIYLTEFAYLCARVAEARIGFERYIERSNTVEGFVSPIRQIKYFWSYKYYDFIPDLLETKMLPVALSDPSYREFKKALFFPEKFPEIFCEAVRSMYKFPQSSLLLIEIANVLRARNMPYEAQAVLSNVLLADPGNVAARVMKMLIHSNIAQTQSDYFVSEMAFARAIAEGEFVCGLNYMDCTIWSEIGALHFNKAKKMIQFLRKGNSVKNQTIIKEDILNSLKKSEEYFLKALAVSPTGHDVSSTFWLLYVKSFAKLVSHNKDILTKPKSYMLKDKDNIFRKIAIHFFTELGWLAEEDFQDGNISDGALQNLLTIFTGMNARHENTMLSRSYIPYTKYLFAISLWDFAPYLSAMIYNMVINLLKDAQSETQKLIADNLSVYRITVNYMAPDQFLLRLQDTIDFINNLVSDDEFQKGYNATLSPEKAKEVSGIKLMLLELDWH